jgi:hypothetical protein
MNMTKTQANKIVQDLFNKIPNIYHGYRYIADKMYDMELKAEKEHRKSRDSVKGFSVGQAAKYFTVKHLIEGKTSAYNVEAILDIRHECLIAQAYATRYAAELADWFALVESSEFNKIDYSDMME